jgi:hypothetical protein
MWRPDPANKFKPTDERYWHEYESGTVMAQATKIESDYLWLVWEIKDVMKLANKGVHGHRIEHTINYLAAAKMKKAATRLHRLTLILKVIGHRLA